MKLPDNPVRMGQARRDFQTLPPCFTLTPSYAGFADIQATKNCFIIVGDTQGTSHWEFWRDRNDRERKLIIDEILRSEPAFVIHLGDLTTRGSSKKHWQEFDDMHKEFRNKKIPYFPILGNHEFYSDDKRALENYSKRFPHLGLKQWHSFTWKNVGLILVDSNFSALTKEQIEEQSQWYLDELQKFEKNTEIDFSLLSAATSHLLPTAGSSIQTRR